MRPDLCAWSKAIANGYALAAVTGNDKFREAATKVFVTGSFWCGTVAMAAARATLKVARETAVPERLRAMGKWMKTNGEAIYGTTASPIPHPAWGRITTKAGDDATTLYLHIFDWPTDGNLAVTLTNTVRDCHLFADPARKFTPEKSNDAGLTIHLSGDAPDPIASVVVLTIDGSPRSETGK